MKKLLFISIFIAFAALINAQTITPGMSGLQLRNAVNAKTSALSDSLLTAFDSITAQRGRIALGLLKSDTAAMLDNYTRNGELLSRLNNYLLKSDTTSMLDNYARNGEVINRLGNYLLKSDTASMLGNYTRNSELNAGLAAKQNTLVSGTNIKTINSQSLLGSGNITISGGGGGDMVYPGAGIPTSTGSAWGSSITNNSANWNTAYNWGNHANAGYFVGTNSTIRGLFSSSATGLSYNNSTGVFSLTSGYGIPTTTNISNWNTAYGWGNHASAGYRTAAQVGAQIHDTIAGGVALSSVAVMIADTANMLAHYLRKCDAGSGGLTSAQVATQIGDTISARLAAAVPGLRLRDSTGNATGNYMTRAGTTTMVNTREAALGNPSTNGYILSSTTAGVRSWIAPPSGGSMVYPSGSGIPIVNNGAWGTTITDNSANWNSAYGWGNHASAGYRNASQVGGQIRDSLIVAKNEDSDTGPLFVFGTGSGHIADTALFNNGRLAGSFYNSGQDTLYVTEVRGVLVEGTGTETITVNISWDVNMRDATPTNMFGTGFTVTSMTTGSVNTSFSNNMIPPGQWVWCTLSGASPNNKPTMLILTMTGYKRNRNN